MLNFLVLGLIPGTRIQITFTLILYVLALMGLTTICYLDRQKLKELVHRLQTRFTKNQQSPQA